jgi:hypothetical protein
MHIDPINVTGYSIDHVMHGISGDVTVTRERVPQSDYYRALIHSTDTETHRSLAARVSDLHAHSDAHRDPASVALA